MSLRVFVGVIVSVGVIASVCWCHWRNEEEGLRH